MKDCNGNVSVPLPQVDDAISPVLADAGDPQRIIARLVSAPLLREQMLEMVKSF